MKLSTDQGRKPAKTLGLRPVLLKPCSHFTSPVTARSYFKSPVDNDSEDFISFGCLAKSLQYMLVA